MDAGPSSMMYLHPAAPLLHSKYTEQEQCIRVPMPMHDVAITMVWCLSSEWDLTMFHFLPFVV